MTKPMAIIKKISSARDKDISQKKILTVTAATFCIVNTRARQAMIMIRIILICML
jgi:hypothetical protein